MSTTINNSVIYDGAGKILKYRLFGIELCRGNEKKSHKTIIHRENMCPLCDSIEHTHMLAAECMKLQCEIADYKTEKNMPHVRLSVEVTGGPMFRSFDAAMKAIQQARGGAQT